MDTSGRYRETSEKSSFNILFRHRMRDERLVLSSSNGRGRWDRTNPVNITPRRSGNAVMPAEESSNGWETSPWNNVKPRT